MKIKVLIVDDSALIRSVMNEIINSQPDMEVVGAAPDPLAARDLIKQTNPDVLTLDVEMPKMDGLEFLEKLMRLRPMPVVMVSSLTERGSEITLRALELGAVDFVTKPKISIQSGMLEYADVIADKIRIAARARIKPRTLPPTDRQRRRALAPLRNPFTSSEKLIIIGASTGGTEAIKDFLIQLPSDCPGILITQHMPEGFTRSFANRLDKLCKITVKEAEGGERVLPGHAYLAPGHSHLLLVRSGANYVTKLTRGRRSTGTVLRSMSCSTRPRSQCRQECGRRHPHRHGQGRRGRDAGNEKGRRLQPRPGRSVVRGVRHAQGSHRHRRHA